MKKVILLVSLFLSAITFMSAQISLVTFSTGYTAPVDIKNCGDDRLFIVEQPGIISICDTNGVKRSQPFLDIQSRVQYGGEQGLLGLAFPKDFLTKGYFYVNYTALGSGRTTISRFHVDPATPDSADANSEEVLLRIYQPFANHNGGHVGFGPDGYLYIGMGDGGSAGDPGNRAQNTDTLLGKMLRLEVNPDYSGYKIPVGNAFANDTTLGRPEIWALGVRNPWRWSFDRITGDLWIGDVGQDNVEEIDFQKVHEVGGLNYGWKCWEGARQNSTATSCLPFSSYTPPVHQYTHQPGGYCSITGGYRYRGAMYQELFGKYFYADYCKSEIQYLEDSSGIFINTNLGLLGASGVTTFGEDKNGEIYLSSSSNSIMKIVSANCNPVSTINAGVDTVYDCGSGSVQLSVPANSGFSYSWTDGSTVVDTTHSFSATQAGTYYITVTNQTCSSNDSIVVQFNNPAPVSFTGLDTLYCIYHNPVILFPNTPGGTFYGHGIISSGFYPTAAGIGTHTIVYNLTDASGCFLTDSQTVRVDACTNVPENLWTNTVSVIPNPSSGIFSINAYSVSEKAVDIIISDVTGRTVSNEKYIFNAGFNSIPVELNAQDGIYLMQISDAESSSIVKIVLK